MSRIKGSSWKWVTEFASSRTPEHAVDAADIGSKPPPATGRQGQLNSCGREHLCISTAGGAVLCDWDNCRRLEIFAKRVSVSYTSPAKQNRLYITMLKFDYTRCRLNLIKSSLTVDKKHRPNLPDSLFSSLFRARTWGAFCVQDALFTMCTMVQHCFAPPCVACGMGRIWLSLVDLGCNNALFGLCFYGHLEAIKSSWGRFWLLVASSLQGYSNL